MAKKNLGIELCDRVHKGFTGLVDHYSKVAAHHEANDQPELASMNCAVKDHCQTTADEVAALRDAAEKVAEAEELSKIRHDGVRGVLSDAPEDARLQLINRVGGAPIVRKSASIPKLGQVEGASELDPEVADLVTSD